MASLSALSSSALEAAVPAPVTGSIDSPGAAQVELEWNEWSEWLTDDALKSDEDAVNEILEVPLASENNPESPPSIPAPPSSPLKNAKKRNTVLSSLPTNIPLDKIDPSSPTSTTPTSSLSTAATTPEPHEEVEGDNVPSNALPKSRVPESGRKKRQAAVQAPVTGSSDSSAAPVLEWSDWLTDDVLNSSFSDPQDAVNEELKVPLALQNNPESPPSMPALSLSSLKNISHSSPSSPTSTTPTSSPMTSPITPSTAATTPEPHEVKAYNVLSNAVPESPVPQSGSKKRCRDLVTTNNDGDRSKRSRLNALLDADAQRVPFEPSERDKAQFPLPSPAEGTEDGLLLDLQNNDINQADDGVPQWIPAHGSNVDVGTYSHSVHYQQVYNENQLLAQPSSAPYGHHHRLQLLDGVQQHVTVSPVIVDRNVLGADNQLPWAQHYHQPGQGGQYHTHAGPSNVQRQNHAPHPHPPQYIILHSNSYPSSNQASGNEVSHAAPVMHTHTSLVFVPQTTSHPPVHGQSSASTSGLSSNLQAWAQLPVPPLLSKRCRWVINQATGKVCGANLTALNMRDCTDANRHLLEHKNDSAHSDWLNRKIKEKGCRWKGCGESFSKGRLSIHYGEKHLGLPRTRN
ncbi:hypothetical protein D9758_015680 [Tetrapyrgos nigripes]|uniref:Uncharacterized protein n=1 Tax=Tetrapyrgos nigripes TaxID=182062 RepID=A0A8H5C7Q3_9AGAR|nr:hypothetical protein D9758_015680 [Tetrapyrgos nigripes]